MPLKQQLFVFTTMTSLLLAGACGQSETEAPEPSPSAALAGNESARKVSAELCLNQPLGGDSAYTVFHNARLDPIMDALGSRGYRVAQLEAGIVCGRLALAAFALGLGASGLTFFDDLVSKYFGTSATPMLVTAVGVPNTIPAPAGIPGAPATLSGYHRLMDQIAFQLRRSAELH